MEGYVTLKSRFFSKQVWMVLDGQTLTYYESLDLKKQLPKTIKGVFNCQNATVTKFNDENNKLLGIKLKSNLNNKSSKISFLCPNETATNSWQFVLERAVKLHEKEEEKQRQIDEWKKMLTIDPNETMTKAILSRTYKRVSLKEHPDKGGSADRFNSIKEAYQHLLAVQSEIEDREQSVLIQYEAVVEKITGVGLGISVNEDQMKHRLIVLAVNPNTKIVGLSEEARGSILPGDALIGIDQDDCSTWHLTRVRARLDLFRVAFNQSVTFTFERRIRQEDLEEYFRPSPPTPPPEPANQEGGDDDNDSQSVHSHDSDNYQPNQQQQQQQQQTDAQSTTTTSPLPTSTTRTTNKEDEDVLKSMEYSVPNTPHFHSNTVNINPANATTANTDQHPPIPSESNEITLKKKLFQSNNKDSAIHERDVEHTPIIIIPSEDTPQPPSHDTDGGNSTNKALNLKKKPSIRSKLQQSNTNANSAYFPSMMSNFTNLQSQYNIHNKHEADRDRDRDRDNDHDDGGSSVYSNTIDSDSSSSQPHNNKQNNNQHNKRNNKQQQQQQQQRPSKQSSQQQQRPPQQPTNTNNTNKQPSNTNNNPRRPSQSTKQLQEELHHTKDQLTSTLQKVQELEAALESIREEEDSQRQLLTNKLFTERESLLNVQQEEVVQLRNDHHHLLHDVDDLLAKNQDLQAKNQLLMDTLKLKSNQNNNNNSNNNTNPSSKWSRHQEHILLCEEKIVEQQQREYQLQTIIQQYEQYLLPNHPSHNNTHQQRQQQQQGFDQMMQTYSHRENKAKQVLDTLTSYFLTTHVINNPSYPYNHYQATVEQSQSQDQHDHQDEQGDATYQQDDALYDQDHDQDQRYDQPPSERSYQYNDNNYYYD